MLHPFVSSQRSRLRRTSGAVVSVVVHAVLITAFVAASGRIAPDLRPRSGTTERVTLHRLDYPGAASASAAAPARTAVTPTRDDAARRQARAMARLSKIVSSIPPIELAIEVTKPASTSAIGPDYATLVTAGLDSAGGGLADAIAQVIGKAYARAEASGVYDEELVERPVSPRRGNPVPSYPSQLMRQGIEAAYFVTYVVDSTGRVDHSSISFPANALEPFVAAIRRALDRSRYFPAQIGGRPVAQRVRQQFRFMLAR